MFEKSGANGKHVNQYLDFQQHIKISFSFW